MIVVIVEIVGIVVTVMILAISNGGGGCDVKLVNYLDDKSQIKDAVRMAEIGLTSTWAFDDFKVLDKMSGLSAKALVVLPCYVSLEVGQLVIAKLATHRLMGDEGLLLEIFNKFVNELKEEEHKHQEDKISSTLVFMFCMLIDINDDDILNASVVSFMSTDILNADDILDASVVSYTSTDILNIDDILNASIVSCTSTDIA
ncbi:hypothetical protein T459_28965 [Capsicum annuum]|uniref:Uncharacterized protein n=1 Tax=Capsicum annuum TaxID=4072 RepID=A0A2G2YI91_CAPAN|nr:hypothetical protein T459_28965 [Capsicum annuum]